MLDGERTALILEVARAKDLGSQVLPHSLAAAQYFSKVQDAICATLEANEATDRLSELHRQLMVHDRGFSDLDPSKYDAERSAIKREIRHLNTRIIQLQREVERCKSADPATAKAVNAFLDDRGCPREDAFRPENFLEQTCRWSSSDLDRLMSEVEIAKGKPRSFDSNSADLVDLDLQSFLHLVSAEIDVSRRYIEICDKIDILASKVCSELLGFEYEKDALVITCACYALRPEEVSNKIAELTSEYADRGEVDLGLQVLLNDRAKLIVQLEQVRTTMAERAKQFESALDAKAIPPTSILREVIPRSQATVVAEGPDGWTVEQRGLIIAIGEWWERCHGEERYRPKDPWDDLAQAMTSRGFELENFLDGKETIAELVSEAKILDWWQLANFVKKIGRKHKELRRILQKRFSEIYHRQYLLLIKPREGSDRGLPEHPTSNPH